MNRVKKTLTIGLYNNNGGLGKKRDNKYLELMERFLIEYYGKKEWNVYFWMRVADKEGSL